MKTSIAQLETKSKASELKLLAEANTHLEGLHELYFRYTLTAVKEKVPIETVYGFSSCYSELRYFLQGEFSAPEAGDAALYQERLQEMYARFLLMATEEGFTDNYVEEVTYTYTALRAFLREKAIS